MSGFSAAFSALALSSVAVTCPGLHLGAVGILDLNINFLIKFGKILIFKYCMCHFFFLLLFWSCHYTYVDMLNFVLEVSEVLFIFYLIFSYVLRIRFFLLICYHECSALPVHLYIITI